MASFGGNAGTTKNIKNKNKAKQKPVRLRNIGKKTIILKELNIHLFFS